MMQPKETTTVIDLDGVFARTGGAENGDEELLVLGDEGGGGSSFAKARKDKMKGPWSPEEDDIPSHLPGRSSKSCHLRWCNQLNEVAQRKPFTMEDVSLDKAKASSEHTQSCGDLNFVKSSEGRDKISSMEIKDNKFEDKDPSTLFRPAACVGAISVYCSFDGLPPSTSIQSPVGAFSVYRSFDGLPPSTSIQRSLPMQGPILQSSKPDNEIGKMIEGIYGDRSVPHQCGHGCCAAPDGSKSKNSLLGPEFIEFSDPPSSPSFELAAIATDICNLAWLKSGLENK